VTSFFFLFFQFCLILVADPGPALVFKTFEKELSTNHANAIKPLERIDVEEGYATKDEANIIVANRSGAVLSASTMLKSDLFINLQKVLLRAC
jgi:hypothetical protein